MTTTARASRTMQFGPIRVDYDERVLVPRPWTLLQSEWAAALAATAEQGPLLELCAGAGHIGLAAAVLADRDLVQVELDPVAAQYARENARRAGRADRVEIRTGRLQDMVAEGEEFPVIIADPPYLPSHEVARWPDDPRAAIDGGADGLDLVRDCLEVAGRHLPAGGALLLQVAGPEQAVAAAQQAAATFVLGETRTVDPQRAVALLRRR